MNIHDMRELIRFARWRRRDIERQKLGSPVEDLQYIVNTLKALVIPKTWPADLLARDAEIGACEVAIRDWIRKNMRETGRRASLVPWPVVDVTSQDGTHTVCVVPEEHRYTRTGVTLRVIDGGKK